MGLWQRGVETFVLLILRYTQPMISAQIIKDSLSPYGTVLNAERRLTTMVLRYPRFIHSELMTHRAFSRNSSSSRAIPVAKLIAEAQDDPATPKYWGANQKGMQARNQLASEKQALALEVWNRARQQAIESAKELTSENIGLHKQIANRLLEPFTHITVIVTGSEYAYQNFFALRCHPDAEPHIQELATKMLYEYRRAQPTSAPVHLPFLMKEEALDLIDRIGTPSTCLVSAARCARVSYLKHDGQQPSLAEDLKLGELLAAEGHMSPFEHQAFASIDVDVKSGNFLGWTQYRQRLDKNLQTFNVGRVNG